MACVGGVDWEGRYISDQVYLRRLISSIERKWLNVDSLQIDMTD